MSEVKEHSVIYLSPSDDPEREWCQDDVWDESVRYNLGADFDRVTAERDALQARETGTRSLLRMAEDSIKHILEREKALQALLTAADERADTAIAILECVLDTGELTREKHLELEADICQLVTEFWGDRKAARIPSAPRCSDCGYTEQDCREHMDHHLCGSPEPAPARKP